jgi:addiction module HigA family antidote
MKTSKQHFPATVGGVIIATIRKRGMTVAAFARDTDVRYDRLNAVINDREKLSIPVALKIAPALGMEPDELLMMQLRQKIETVRKKMALHDHSPRPA